MQSGRAAYEHIQNGNYWSGAGYTILAISDVFLVKAVYTAVAKVIAVTGTKVAANTGIANSRALGIAGEQTVGVGSKTRIPSLAGTAKYRIPTNWHPQRLGK